ncbi:hypothetical protein AWB74_02517 [Caballeronia arvi]|uniref:Uncharacterized protein n=1 Tax=Caballeronia arvi TaxID=1777135 RepID=A0A158IEQ3_9BURK|nr:hypothetical protein AWB74_02517 [Caballeronia arvi]
MPGRFRGSPGALLRWLAKDGLRERVGAGQTDGYSTAIDSVMFWRM